MADVLAISILLVFLGSSYPGLLTFYWLLFPQHTARSKARLQRSLWGSFLVGLVLLLVFGLPAVILLNLPSGLAQLLGWLVVAFLLLWSSLGAAGLALYLSDRLHRHRPEGLQPATAYLHGVLVLELASAFPLIGWFVVFPVALLVSLGSSFLGIFSRTPALTPSPAGAQPVLESSPAGPGL